jgi:hypothetical protein
MKRFDYEAIFILAHGRPSLIVDFYKGSTAGPNFIINPKALVGSFWLTDRQKAEYLGICALRSYEDYRFTGEANLSINSIPSNKRKPTNTTNRNKTDFSKGNIKQNGYTI